VPQDIYLIDKSIAENIAFGEHPDEQDGAALIAAARAAQIHDFISNELPQGYGTIVGERGIRLSGGQKQRIGIARALYRNPSVLIMDEATSALDQNTERSVHKAIVDIAAHKTVILIAHRMNTVRDCDQIFVFEKGNLVASGDYGELSSTSPQFQQLSNTPNATTA
jgi:ABC-type multidrug transport system fused ATPase/permease subunit